VFTRRAVTIAGGRTTYRSMAEDAVDRALAGGVGPALAHRDLAFRVGEADLVGDGQSAAMGIEARRSGIEVRARRGSRPYGARWKTMARVACTLPRRAEHRRGAHCRHAMAAEPGATAGSRGSVGVHARASRWFRAPTRVRRIDARPERVSQMTYRPRERADHAPG
jgi:glycerol-3-phosphate dehydrogenase